MPPALRRQAAKASERSAKEFKEILEREVPSASGDAKETIVAYAPTSSVGTVWRVAIGVREGKGFYIRFREFGTSEQQADPFFFPAYRSIKPKHKRRMSRAQGLAAKEVFG